MFLTSIYYKMKQMWEYLTYPSKYYAKKYAKQYVEEYSKNNKTLNDHIITDDSGDNYYISDYNSYYDFYKTGNESPAYRK